MTSSIKQTIERLKHQSGALPPLEAANHTESALMRGLLSNDLWDASDYKHNPKERLRAATAIRNLVRYNCMMSLLDALLSAHNKHPNVPTEELLGSLALTIMENEEELVNKPIAHLCAYLVHKIDQLETKDSTKCHKQS